MNFAPPLVVEPLRRLVRAYFRFFHATRFTGRRNLPPPGPALFAANHLSYYDPVLVMAGQDEMMRGMSWGALFQNRLLGKLLTDWGAFPVDVEGRDPGGFRTSLRLLKAGERILVFPEGGRSFDGELMPLREGVARMAMRSGVPICPVRITGADCAWNRSDLAPRAWFPIQVHYGPCIIPRTAKTKMEREAEAARIMDALRERLTGASPSAPAESDSR